MFEMWRASPSSLVRSFGWGAVLIAASASAQTKDGSQTACPPAVSESAEVRWGRVFIDGKQVGTNLKVKRTSDSPENYEIVDPEPPELAKLPVARIDLIQFQRGAEAEAKYHLCAGMVAVVITTKGPKRRP